jgi:predicted ArsR family transcriptional regulator
MERIQPITSRLAYDKIMKPGAKDSMYKKIILALEWRMDGTSWEIASQIRCKPDKVWKRLSELRRDDVVFDTKIRRNSPDGNDAMVYALSSRKSEYANVKPPEKYSTNTTTAADYASKIIAKTTKGIAQQQQLFM